MSSMHGLSGSRSVPSMGGVMGLPRKILFWQGYLPEDPEYDLEFYLQDFNPRLARFILRHRYLRQGLSIIRSYYPLTNIIFMFTSSTIVHPTSMYLHWGNNEYVVDNFYPLFLFTFLGIYHCFVFFQKHGFNRMLRKFSKFQNRREFKTEENQLLLHKVDKLSNDITKFVILGIFPFMIGSLCLHAFVGCLPYRNQFFKGWYPFDDGTSPVYELTLLVNIFEMCSIAAASNSLLSFAIAVPLYLRVYFKMICNNLKNVQKLSFENIKRRKKNELRSRSINENPLRIYLRRMSVSCNEVVDVPKCLTRQTRRHQPRSEWPRYNLYPKKTTCTVHELEIEMKRQLDKCVIAHQCLLEFTNEFHALFKHIFVTLIVANMAVYGAAVLLVVTNTVFTLKICLLVYVSFQIVIFYFILSALETAINEQSEEVGNSVTSCDWSRLSTSYKRSMLIVMIRANQTVEFKPPGFDPVGLKLFGETSSIAYKMTFQLMTFLK